MLELNNVDNARCILTRTVSVTAAFIGPMFSSFKNRFYLNHSMEVEAIQLIIVICSDKNDLDQLSN